MRGRVRGHRPPHSFLSRRTAPARRSIDEHLAEGATHEDALTALLRWLERRFPDHRLIAAGHRVVHGGSAYNAPVRIDASVSSELTDLIPLAPLHQPHHLAAIAALSKLYPALPQIACFDTSFHHTQPAVATAFALPRRLSEEGVRRYGFHGLSYEYIASVLPEVLGPQLAEGRVVVAHLGNGASMCAMHRRKSVATTMGFTALDGLPMGQRCGNLDPGVVLYLMQQKRMSADAVSDLLYHDSGLFGVSGISNDMRTLLASHDPHAAEAVDLFVYRIGRELGSLAASPWRTRRAGVHRGHRRARRRNSPPRLRGCGLARRRIRPCGERAGRSRAFRRRQQGLRLGHSRPTKI